MFKPGFRDVRGGTEFLCGCIVSPCAHEATEKPDPDCGWCGETVAQADEIVTAEGERVHADCLAAYRLDQVRR